MDYLGDFRQVIHLKQIIASAPSPLKGCNDANKENTDTKMFGKF